MQAAGFTSVGVAAGTGVIRFGLNPSFSPYHKLLTFLSGNVGIPLVGLGFALDAEVIFESTSVYIVAGLIRGLGTSRLLSFQDDAYTGVLSGIGLLAVVPSSRQKSVGLTNADIAVLLFLLAGAMMSSETKIFEMFVFCVRKVNWFDYFVGVAILLLAQL